MKGYFITEAQMNKLPEMVEAQFMRVETGRAAPVANTPNEIFRTINFAVHRWIEEVSK